MNESQRLLARKLGTLGAAPRVSTRTAKVVEINGPAAKVLLSGITTEYIPFDTNISVLVGDYVRLQIEDNVPRIVAKQS